MADGRHFEKNPLNRHISATVRPILMKFGIVMAAILKNRKNRYIKAAD